MIQSVRMHFNARSERGLCDVLEKTMHLNESSSVHKLGVKDVTGWKLT